MKIRRELGVPRLGLGFRAWDGDALRSAAVRSVGWGSGRGAESRSRQRLSLGENEAGSDASSPSPTEEAINSNRRTGARRLERSNSDAPGGCPTAEGPTSNSNRRTGPGTKGFINSAWSGPRYLRRATSNPQRQHSLVGDPSRERIRSVRSYPGNRDRAPRFLWSETLVKPNNAVIVAAFAAAKEVLQHPLRQIPQSVNRNRHPAQLLPPPSKAE